MLCCVLVVMKDQTVVDSSESEKADRLVIRFNYIEEEAGFLESTTRTLLSVPSSSSSSLSG